MAFTPAEIAIPPPGNPVTIERTLVLSTAHLRESTAEILNVLSYEAQLALSWGPQLVWQYGWIWYTQDLPTIVDFPEEFTAIFEFARARGCKWIRFDCDADIINNLPHWEW